MYKLNQMHYVQQQILLTVSQLNQNCFISVFPVSVFMHPFVFITRSIKCFQIIVLSLHMNKSILLFVLTHLFCIVHSFYLLHKFTSTACSCLQILQILIPGILIILILILIMAWKFGRNDCFITTLFLSLIKDGNNNSFPQIHLHNTNAFF